MEVWFFGSEVKKGRMPAACCPHEIPTIAYEKWDIENPRTDLWPEYFQE